MEVRNFWQYHAVQIKADSYAIAAVSDDDKF